jgi:CBS-domain-containing membrane protein
MSGPKGGAVALGGAAVLAGPIAVAAVAAVALPVVATSLLAVAAAVSENKKKRKKNNRGAEKFLNSYQNERNNMIAEVERIEKPIQSLLTNGELRWDSMRQDIDKIRQEVQTEVAKLKNTAGMPQTKDEVEKYLQQAESLLTEAGKLQQQFIQFRNDANKKFNAGKNNTTNDKRTIRQFAANGSKDGDQAIGAINQAVEKARSAKIKFKETLLIILKKGEEERQEELLRQDAVSNIAAAKSEIVQENVLLINDWINEDAVRLLEEHQEKADQAMAAKRYKEASLLAQETVAMYRQFFDTALRTKQQFENREIITDAIVAALNDLQYDEPDVNYEPKEGIDNAMFGNITIFAKSKGESGDMRLAIDLEGGMKLDVVGIPEGKESECHNAITNLQSKIKEVVDFDITDWGRAKNVKNTSTGNLPKQKIQIQNQIKHRG